MEHIITLVIQILYKMSNTIKIKCRLFDKMTNEWHDYKESIYTKLDGIYGYICIDVMSVKFFWYDETSKNVCFDDVTERFHIEYSLSNN